MGRCRTMAAGHGSGSMTLGRRIAFVAIGYPVLEILVAWAVASVIGWGWVLMAFLVGVILGLGTVRYAASAAGRSWTSAMGGLRTIQDTTVPLPIESARPIPDVGSPAQTSLLIPAGLLIAVPGFISDIAGIILLLPMVRRRIARRLESAVRRGAARRDEDSG